MNASWVTSSSKLTGWWMRNLSCQVTTIKRRRRRRRGWVKNLKIRKIYQKMRRDRCCSRKKNCWRRKRIISYQLLRGKLPHLRRVWWMLLKVRVQVTILLDLILIMSNMFRPRCLILWNGRGNLKIPLVSSGKNWDLQNQEPIIPINLKSATAQEVAKTSCFRVWLQKTGKEKPCLRRPDSKASRHRWRPTNRTGRWTQIWWRKTTKWKEIYPSWRCSQKGLRERLRRDKKICRRSSRKVNSSINSKSISWQSKTKSWSTKLNNSRIVVMTNRILLSNWPSRSKIYPMRIPARTLR